MPLTQPMILPAYTLRMPASHTRVTFEFTPRCEKNDLTCDTCATHSAYVIPFVVPTCASVYNTVDYALAVAYNYLNNFETLSDLIDTHTVETTSIVKVTD